MFASNGYAIFILTLISLFSIISPFKFTPCQDTFLRMTHQRNITLCKKLTTLEAEFGWKLSNVTQNTNKIEIFFGTKIQKFQSEIAWIGWGINPGSRPQMVGTRAIIGIKYPNGSMPINTYYLTSDTKLGCTLLPSKIDVDVVNMTLEFNDENGYLSMYVILVLLNSVYDVSKLNYVWQIGYDAQDLEPKMHLTTLQNVDSTQTIDLKSGKSLSIGRQHRHYFRRVHGILNIVGWGTLLPIGVIIARYSRKFPLKYKGWFANHVGCQIIGYCLGTTGWGIGLWLGHASVDYSFNTHRILSIFIFTFATLQVLALRLKPKITDKYRKYWNMYHHFLGYGLIVAISVNIFHGISILKPNNKTWEWVYIGVIVLSAFVTFVFELFTWAKFILKKGKTEKPNPGPNTSQ